jgi:hypothetical protein
VNVQVLSSNHICLSTYSNAAICTTMQQSNLTVSWRTTLSGQLANDPQRGVFFSPHVLTDVHAVFQQQTARAATLQYSVVCDNSCSNCYCRLPRTGALLSRCCLRLLCLPLFLSLLRLLVVTAAAAASAARRALVYFNKLLLLTMSSP